MKLKLLNNKIYRDRLVSLINTECQMLPGLDSERCSECPKTRLWSSSEWNKVRKTFLLYEALSIATMVERKRCVASPMPHS